MTANSQSFLLRLQCGLCGHVDDVVTLHRHYCASHTTLPAQVSTCPQPGCLWLFPSKSPHLDDHLNRHSLYEQQSPMAKKCHDCRLDITGHTTTHFQHSPHIVASFLKHLLPVSGEKHPLASSGVSEEVTRTSPTRADTSGAHHRAEIHNSNIQHTSPPNSRFKQPRIGIQSRGSMTGVRKTVPPKRTCHTLQKLATSTSTPRPHAGMDMGLPRKRVGGFSVAELLSTSGTEPGASTAFPRVTSMPVV